MWLAGLSRAMPLRNGGKMKPATYITTSWDDGHRLDFRVAELLTKHGIGGTFYVPRSAEHGVMSASELRELSGAFEAGAHTLHHTVLATATDEHASTEIVDSKAWIEDNTGKPCLMFCPPQGRFSVKHVHMVRRAGYVGLRSVELASLDLPRARMGIMVMPTTVQAYPHGRLAYARNTLKRMELGNLWRFVAHGRPAAWTALADGFMREVRDRGGVFHLWGHSWELEETSQWQRLDEVLRFMSGLRGEIPSLTNGQTCLRSLSPMAHPAAMLEKETVIARVS
jgi:peptidoglycan/xylan/chitin deacetylase (PgdA/CDA1 family)